MRFARVLSPALFLAVPVAASIACGSSKSSNAADGAAVARFALSGDAPPTFLDVPFPSDAYRTPKGLVEIPGLDRVFRMNAVFLSHELAKQHGFSRIAPAMFYVDDLSAPKDADGNVAHAEIDPASLPADEASCTTDASSVYFVDLEASDASQARVPCRASFHDDAHHLSKTRPVLTVGPARGVLLAEGHRYAAVVTSRVVTKSGAHLAASADFAKIASGARDGAIAAAYGDAYDKARAALASALAGDAARIVSIAAFTTNDQTKELFALRDALEDAPPKPLAWDAQANAPMTPARFARPVDGALPAGFTASLDDWLGVVDASAKLPDGTDDPSDERPVRAHDAIAAVGTAVFDADNYLVHKPGRYDDLDHATMAYDASGKIVPAPDQPTQKIWVTFAVPTAPMPEHGYPTVIVQHGLNGSRAYLLELANVFAAKGWMAVAIDSVTFGARAPEPELQVDRSTDYEAAPGAKYKGPDGLSDEVNGARNGSGDLFGGLKNIGAIRDQFREAAIDTAQLVKVLRASPDLSPLRTGAAAPKIDPDRIAYMGDSLGAIEGVTAAAIEPYLKTFFFNVVGAGLFTELAARSPSISFQLAAAGGLFFGLNGDRFSETDPFVILCQNVIDAGDPIGFAPYLVTSPGSLKGVKNPPKSFVQTQVLWDEIVSNEANEAFTRAAGVHLATPNVGSNSGLQDVKDPAGNPARVPLVDERPDGSGLFHDTPIPGVTAISVQISPAAHGADLVRQLGMHQFVIPFGRFDQAEAFTRLDAAKQFAVKQKNLELQAMMTRFFDDAFRGKVPTVPPFRAPVRDYDGDGATDDVDAAPADPTVK